ncbi:hypothetical protein, partial [Clostridium arbusti]|uniref:hypothetical protein n=1 Tax=Clostridium arbusti TaxID=1137848 RepID=UPI000289FB8F
MDGITKILQFIIKLINDGNYEVIFYTIIIILFLWIFKEFRKTKLESDTLGCNRINDALKLYGKALFSIIQYQNGIFSYSSVFENLYALFPYATKEIIDLINEFSKHSDPNNVVNLKLYLEKEVKYLKSLQYDDVSFRFDNKFLNAISYYYNKNNFSSFIIPVVNSFVCITSILILVIYLFSFASANVFNRIIICILIFTLIMHAFLIIATVDLIFNKKFQKNTRNCI